MGNRGEYELAVRALHDYARDRIAAGSTVEAVARELVSRRNALKLEFRRFDPPSVVALIERRNIKRYGNPVGPDADQLLEKYASWEAVIAAACRHAKFGNG